MRKSRLILFAAGAALFLFGAQAFAEVTVTITAPTLTFSGNTTAVDNALNALFASASSAYNAEIADYQTEANDTLDPYGNLDKLAQGFADSNVMASNAGTLPSCQGYKLFTVSAGIMGGAQLPTTDLSTIQNFSATLNDDPNQYLGAAPALNVNVGFHVGTLLKTFGFGDNADRWYVNVHGGRYNGSYDAKDSSFDMKTTSVGFGVNYQLIKPKSVAVGLFKWRGVSVGSGLSYQRNTFDSTTTLDTIVQPISMDTDAAGPNIVVSGDLTSTPVVGIGVDMKTYSIPLQAATSFQVLWVLNVSAGIGADIVFGKSDIIATSSSNLNISNVSTTVAGVSTPLTYDETDGSVTVDASTTDIKPTLARARVNLGLGINAGPFKIDVPLYYYFSDGIAMGMTVGFVW
jgi:hypothetical protein